jgi:hypothetical protein
MRGGVDSEKRVSIDVRDPDRSGARRNSRRIQADPWHGVNGGVELRVDASDGACVAVQDPDRVRADGEPDRERFGRSTSLRNWDLGGDGHGAGIDAQEGGRGPSDRPDRACAGCDPIDRVAKHASARQLARS